MADSKRCARCTQTKPLAEFRILGTGKRHSWCKDCQREYARTRYAHKAQPDIPEGMSWCGKCERFKPLADFYQTARGLPRKPCKACYRDWHRSRYAPSTGADDNERPCARCGKPYRPKTRRPSNCCSRECSEQLRKETGRIRDAHLRRKYGISAVDYDRMLADQGGGCAICGIPPEELAAGRFRTYLHVDHCHETGTVRGLLCPDCNLKIGQWNHDPALLRRAADYLEACASD